MKHWTKDKGDIGVGFVVADLMSRGIHVALPISEHLPFDCVAISETLQMRRVSIKFRKMNQHGIISVPLRSIWTDKHGNHIKQHDKTTYDCIAIYCPDTKICYYVRMDEIDTLLLTIRVIPSKNNQKKHVKLAKNFEDPERIFASVMAAPSKR